MGSHFRTMRPMGPHSASTAVRPAEERRRVRHPALTGLLGLTLFAGCGAASGGTAAIIALLPTGTQTATLRVALANRGHGPSFAGTLAGQSRRRSDAPVYRCEVPVHRSHRHAGPVRGRHCAGDRCPCNHGNIHRLLSHRPPASSPRRLTAMDAADRTWQAAVSTLRW